MRILLVEDEVGIARFVKQGLEEESYLVDVATEGNNGLSMAISGSYDLIILDWMLPELNGIDICSTFRKSHPLTPVIFLTAKDTVADTILGLKAGANDFIKKPFHFEELLERIKVQLRNTIKGNEVLHLNDIELDTVSHTVKRRGVELSLTQKEFALLELLIRNKGSVCSRSVIIKKVWDIHFDYDTGVIDVFMSSLRKKLNLTEKDNYLQTVRGVGFIAREQ